MACNRCGGMRGRACPESLKTPGRRSRLGSISNETPGQSACVLGPHLRPPEIPQGGSPAPQLEARGLSLTSFVLDLPKTTHLGPSPDPRATNEPGTTNEPRTRTTQRPPVVIRIFQHTYVRYICTYPFSPADPNHLGPNTMRLPARELHDAGRGACSCKGWPGPPTIGPSYWPVAKALAQSGVLAGSQCMHVLAFLRHAPPPTTRSPGVCGQGELPYVPPFAGGPDAAGPWPPFHKLESDTRIPRHPKEVSMRGRRCRLVGPASEGFSSS